MLVLLSVIIWGDSTGTEYNTVFRVDEINAYYEAISDLPIALDWPFSPHKNTQPSLRNVQSSFAIFRPRLYTNAMSIMASVTELGLLPFSFLKTLYLFGKSDIPVAALPTVCRHCANPFKSDT